VGQGRQRYVGQLGTSGNAGLFYPKVVLSIGSGNAYDLATKYSNQLQIPSGGLHRVKFFGGWVCI